MLTALIIFYTIYTIVDLSVTILNKNFIKTKLYTKPIILDKEKFIEAGKYKIDSLTLDIYNKIYSYIVFLFFINFGLEYIDNIISNLSLNSQIIKAVVYIDIFIILNWFISLPFDLYTTFILDKKYEFSNMTIKLFISDTIKSTFVFLTFGNAVIAGISYIILNFHNWWIYGFVFIFIVIILINMLYPIFREKMFDKFEPLKDKELQEKIENLLLSVNFKSNGIFSVDASKRDNRLNAYFGGLGKSKRVVLFDTLIQKLSHGELLAVLGHELGHFKHKDIIKNIIMMGIMMFIFFAIFGNIPQVLFEQIKIQNQPYAIIALFLMISPALTYFIMPIISFTSRINEYKADEFGSKLQSNEELINALLKLANENKSFPYSHSLDIFFHHSHPPLIQRLQKLGYKI